MASGAVRERIAADVALWRADGLVPPEVARRLADRYQASAFGVGVALRYLGIVGAALAALGLIGFVVVTSGSAAFAVAMLGGVSLIVSGVARKLARDPDDAYPHSSKALLALGFTGAVAAVGISLYLLGLRGDVASFSAAFVGTAGSLWLAYRGRDTFLLVLALLSLFAAAGASSSMMGRSSYTLFVNDPLTTGTLGAVMAVVGVWHERALRRETLRFYQAYEGLGLAALNLSLLLASVWRVRGDSGVFFALLLALAGGAQIVVGARLHNGLFTGFGVVAIGLTLFTRFFEHFWNAMAKGLFFVVVGGLSLGAGVALEVALKRRRETS